MLTETNSFLVDALETCTLNTKREYTAGKTLTSQPLDIVQSDQTAEFLEEEGYCLRSAFQAKLELIKL